MVAEQSATAMTGPSMLAGTGVGVIVAVGLGAVGEGVAVGSGVAVGAGVEVGKGVAVGEPIGVNGGRGGAVGVGVLSPTAAGTAPPTTPGG